MITKIIDQSPISRDAYRKKKINGEMSQQIPISILNITDISLIFIATNKSFHINDLEIEEEILKYISKTGY
ncbi:11062_t:CDS:2 [Dentiscutata erythropus]|uniref:11062_t:CDS:1 n=1 Tax=Dentiscutata erythropus TaxID=1348616 RepID=A0A9N9E2M1_9GLOM|nr:11062_t:CDS:2 [Dentiscutata erythropus]